MYIGYLLGVENGVVHDIDVAEVDPDTICQYTGLTDKNGKKVYENDVLMCFGDPKYLVKVLFNEFEVIDGDTELPVESVDGWNYVWIKPNKMRKCEYPMPLTNLYFKTCKMEVVGNTFDNTELLEDKKDETI